MKIWLVNASEPLPTDGGNSRLFRVGMLARYLSDHGHDVLWWASSFDHVRKTQRVRSDTVMRLNERLRIALLRSSGYRRNVSLSRVVDHFILGRKFRRLADRYPKPDIILSSLPTLDLAVEACRYGRRRAVPVIVDIRDLWPDVFLDIVPAVFTSLARAALSPYRWMARRACAQASAIIGPNSRYISWGLAQGARLGTALDRQFPFAYPAETPAAEARSCALSFWRDHGITAGDGRFNVAFFGTLGRQFDLETVLIAARMPQLPPSVRFVICGAGDREGEYRSMAQGCGNVVFPGWVGAADIWTLMRMSSVGLAPYLPTANFENHIPNKPIEYLSAGLPILTTLSGTLGSLLTQNDCGYVYQAGDSCGLVEHLERLQRDRIELQRLSANAAAIFQARFTAEKVHSDLLGYLQSVVKDAQL